VTNTSFTYDILKTATEQVDDFYRKSISMYLGATGGGVRAKIATQGDRIDKTNQE